MENSARVIGLSRSVPSKIPKAWTIWTALSPPTAEAGDTNSEQSVHTARMRERTFDLI